MVAKNTDFVDHYFWGLSGHEDGPSEEHVATQWMFSFVVSEIPAEG